MQADTNGTTKNNEPIWEEYWEEYICPECGRAIEHKQQICEHCGQAIIWREP